MKDRADYLIREKIFDYMYSTVPDAPENRHNVKGGRSCFCQLLEQTIAQNVNVLPTSSASNLTIDVTEPQNAL